MAERNKPPKQLPPRDAKGQFTKRRPIPEALIARLGEGRSALAPYLDDAVPWVVVTRKQAPR
jgi:hypothetical protein